MKPTVYIISQKGTDMFFGFVADCPAICAQADSVDTVNAKLVKYRDQYAQHVSRIAIDTQELVTL